MGIKRIILWGAWYGSKNVGDQVLLLSITDMLGAAIEGAEFIVITANPAHVVEYTKRDSPYRFRALHARRQFPEMIKAFANADLFVFGGGVPFYDDTVHSFAIAVLVTLARAFRVPCVLWSVSSQKIRSAWTKLILRYLLSWTSVATCRDRHTLDLFRKCSSHATRWQIVPDPAFTLRSNDGENVSRLLKRIGWKSEQSRPLVALSPRLLRGKDGEAHIHYSPKSDADNQREVNSFAAVLDWLWENGYQPIFVPMNTVAPDDDRVASREIMARSQHGNQALLIDEEIFPRDVENVYKNCSAAFVARVHGSITAFLARCPMLMYAFDLKHGGIMEQMGLTEQILEPGRHLPEDAVEMMSKLLSSRTDLVQAMARKHEELVRQAQVPRDAILRLLKLE